MPEDIVNATPQDEIEVILEESGSEEPRLELGAEIVPDPEADRFPERVSDADFKTTAKDRIRKLTFQVHEQDRQRQAALAERQAALAYAAGVKSELERARLGLSETHKIARTAATQSAESKMAQLQQQLQEANERADYASAAKLTAQMSDVASQRTQLSSIPDIPVLAVPDFQIQQQQPDVADVRADQWRSENPWFQLDQAGKPANDASAYALQQHEAIVRQVPVGSDAYYAAVDAAMAKFNKTPPQPQRRATSPVAPSARVNTSAPRQVTLTPGEARAARNLGVPYAEYAKYKVAQETNHG